MSVDAEDAPMTDQMRTVLFLCTGNYYRSRFAETLFNVLARQRGLDWRAVSRGLKIGWPGNVGPISPHALARLRERQILGPASEADSEPTIRLSRELLAELERMPLQCCDEDFRAADRIVALKEAEHRPMVEQNHPAYASRVEYWHVHDVDQASPEQALDEVERLVRAMIESMASETCWTAIGSK